MRHPVFGAAFAASLTVFISSSAFGIDTKAGRVDLPELRASLFSGSESRISEFGWLNPDCTPTTPDIRVINAPVKGTLRFEDSESFVSATTHPVSKKCYGKPTRNVMLYYRAHENLGGRDKVVLDVDSRLGKVFRYTFLVDVSKTELKPEAAKESAPQPKQLAEIVQGLPERRFTRSVFANAEARIAAMNYVNTDCTSGPLPNVRIVNEPKNGGYRLEETEIPVDRGLNNSRSTCNGKSVKALAVYYKPNAEYTGNDGMVIDVDFKDGNVRRFVYAITVR